MRALRSTVVYDAAGSRRRRRRSCSADRRTGRSPLARRCTFTSAADAAWTDHVGPAAMALARCDQRMRTPPARRVAHVTWVAHCRRHTGAEALPDRAWSSTYRPRRHGQPALHDRRLGRDPGVTRIRRRHASRVCLSGSGSTRRRSSLGHCYGGASGRGAVRRGTTPSGLLTVTGLAAGRYQIVVFAASESFNNAACSISPSSPRRN
jgi:hypothetical protein